jgi:hypothetical protein
MSGGPIFNIGSQQAGSINNVAGDFNVGTFESSLQTGNQLVTDLRRALDQTEMPARTRTEVGRELNAVERELGRPQPDKATVAERLERLTKMLTGAGALATAANTVLPILHTLAGWLGGAGAGLAALIV